MKFTNIYMIFVLMHEMIKLFPRLEFECYSESRDTCLIRFGALSFNSKAPSEIVVCMPLQT